MTPEFDQPLSNCQLCNSTNIRQSKTDYRGIKIAVCKDCSIEFMNPQYTDGYLSTFYSQYQREDSNHHRYGDKTKPRELIHDYNIQQIEKHVTPGNFLSVGCGNGLDVKMAMQRGWHAEGYEVGQEYPEELASQLNAVIYTGDFVDIVPGKKYSCIYLNHVLEHPKNPGAYLNKIKDLLEPGGILYIACPNIDSLANGVKTVFENIGLKKSKGKHYDTWHHLFYYSPKKLSKLLSTVYGFEVLYAGNDKKATKTTTSISHSFHDDYPYKSSFRMIVRKPK